MEGTSYQERGSGSRDHCVVGHSKGEEHWERVLPLVNKSHQSSGAQPLQSHQSSLTFLFWPKGSPPPLLPWLQSTPFQLLSSSLEQQIPQKAAFNFCYNAANFMMKACFIFRSLCIGSLGEKFWLWTPFSKLYGAGAKASYSWRCVTDQHHITSFSRMFESTTDRVTKLLASYEWWVRNIKCIYLVCPYNSHTVYRCPLY